MDGEASRALGIARRVELYTALVEAFPLLEHHRAALQQKRGFTDETIDRCRFRSGGKHAFGLVREIQAATGAADDELLAAGLLVPRRSDGKAFAWGQLLEDVVIIPYLRADGEQVYHLRPHKLGLPSAVAEIQPYSELTALGWAESDVLILTEGEFKAAAAAQLGYRALAVPGISSFAGKHFDRLQGVIAKVPHKRLVVMFDRETKADPALPGYKDDFRKRYDTEFYTWSMAHRLSAQVCQLPPEWMHDGKIDIDGAVADGRGRAEFDALLRQAVAPEFFLNQLDPEAGSVVMRKVKRALKLDKPKELRVFDSRHLGCGYSWEEENDTGVKVTPISNFIMRLERVVQTDDHVERVVRVIDETGEMGPPVTVGPDDVASLRSWRRWCAAHGELSWPGRQHHLDAVWHYLYSQSDGAVIRRTVLGGEIEPNLWLFQNGVITNGRYVAPRDADGLTWIGRRGYEMAELEGQPRLLRDDPEAVRTLGKPHLELLELLFKNQQRPIAWLALGWGLATLFSRVLFARFKCFPILYCMGEAGSGKTTMARWLMNGFFGIDTQGKPMMSTEKSQYRLLAKRCSMAAWFDEFRETRDMSRHITAFCSVYNRQPYSRAKRTGGLETDSVPVRGSLLLGGVVPPKDDQLLSRVLLAHFAIDRRDNRAEDEAGTYPEIELRLERLNDFLISALLRYDELLPEVIAETRVAKAVFQRRTGNTRMSLNYAMAVAAFHAVCGDLVDTNQLIDFVLASMSESGARLLSEHPLADFWEAVSAMATDGYIGKDHLAADAAHVHLWLPGIFQAYERNHRQRRGDLTFRVADLKDWIEREPYYVPPPGGNGRRDRLIRVNGKPKRVVTLRRDLCPLAITEALGEVRAPDSPADPELEDEAGNGFGDPQVVTG